MPLDDIRIVLIEPAHPGNIGAVARAMKTMALRDLTLVRPAKFPAEDADRRAMGAIDILQQARVVDDFEQAVGDCELVIGGSARERTVPHEVLDARQCGRQLVEESARGRRVAVVFGPERTGLANQDLDRCHLQVVIPTSDAFSSLNLASAVQLVCYEIFVAAREYDPVAETRDKLASWEQVPEQRDLEYFYEHLERALDATRYLRDENREITMTKLRRVFGRSRPNVGELKLLHSLVRLMYDDRG
jgi:tRNA (cytidine32/uridine32-2'-O)-methyltransferase